MSATDRALLTALFDRAIRATDPLNALKPHLPEPPKGRVVVVGAGKGAAQMAAAFESLWSGPLSGMVVTRPGFGTETRRIRVIEASHPVPDESSLKAAEALFQAVRGLGPDDLVVALIAGGGSALLAAPAPGLSLQDEVAVNRALLASGAPISAMNAIRRQISAIKGGRLAQAAHPARVVTLIVSDVPGDDPAEVASGPTVPAENAREAALQALDRYAIDLPPHVLQVIRRTNAPRPDDPAFARDSVHIVASARTALEAAAADAERRGLHAAILSDAFEGDSATVARLHAAMARETCRHDRPFARPALLLSGGETTVALGRAAGRGGPNSAFALAFAMAVEGWQGITGLFADTDGIDGTGPHAGGLVDGGTVGRIRDRGGDPLAALEGADSAAALDLAGDLFNPGPTGTNVNDFRAVLVR